MAGYGRTLALEPNGDLRINQLNRLEWQEGTDAVVQELKVLLATIEGEDPFDPDHGLNVFAATGTSEEQLKLEVGRALNGDDRVQSVENVEINTDETPNRRDAEITITVLLRSEDKVTFTVIP